MIRARQAAQHLTNHRENKSFIVVRVFPNKVDSPWTIGSTLRFTSKFLHEGCLCPVDKFWNSGYLRGSFDLHVWSIYRVVRKHLYMLTKVAKPCKNNYFWKKNDEIIKYIYNRFNTKYIIGIQINIDYAGYILLSICRILNFFCLNDCS